MFKKLFLIVAILSGWGANSLWAWQQIPMHIVKDDASGAGPTYAPPRPLYITPDDYVLTLPLTMYPQEQPRLSFPLRSQAISNSAS